jgi:hypothetical protein
VRFSIVCPGQKPLPISLPNGLGQRMPVWAEGTLVQEHPGQATLLEQDDVFTVVDAEGNTVFTGGEVGAEFKYWNTVFGVEDDAEVDQ